MKDLSIRPMADADIEPVAGLLSRLATEFITHEFDVRTQDEFLAKNDAAAIRGFLAKSFRYHVAELGGHIVGFVGVREDRHLYHLFVAKHLQRRGIGRQLWEAAMRDCQAAGHRGAFTVNASNNAIAVYERWGFRRDGPARETNGVRYNPMRLESASMEAGIFIRPLSDGDLASLFAAVSASKEAVGQWMSWCHPDYSMEDAAHWISHSEAEWATGSDREFGIFDALSGEVLGCAGINQFNRIHNYANLGYWVRTSHVGRGIASRATLQIARRGFSEFELSRIEIVAQVDNAASRRVAEKVGSRFEGIARNRILFRGQPRDAALYSLVPGDLDG